MDFHRLAMADFDELSAGGGHTELVLRLRATQLSKRLLALRAVMDDAARRAPEAFTVSGLAHSYGVLAAAQRRAPAEIQDLLLAPGLGLWAMHCLRRIRGPVTSPAPLENDLGLLGAFAVAAALRAALDVEVTVLMREGELTLPTVGRIHADVSGWTRVRVDGATVVLADRTSPLAMGGPPIEPTDGAWRPALRLSSTRAGQRIDLLLDDLDPAREVLDLPLSPTAAVDNADVWQQRLDEAWLILNRYDPLLAAAIAAGLSAIFPLLPTTGATELSASSGEAFGAVALTLPRDGVSFAAGLVHEFQHTKLSALLDLVPLTEATTERLFYAPWRADPRPVPGLLQGTYAYLGLTGFWQFQRGVDTGSDYAHFEFARWREEVWRTLSTLRISGLMTRLGMRFLDGMQATVWSHRQAPVPPEPLRLARDVSADTRITWRLRNLRADPDQVRMLAHAWSAGSVPVSAQPVRTRIIPGVRGLNGGSRLALAQLRLTDPKRFHAAREGVPHVLDDGISAADQAYAFGDLRSAVQLYKEELVGDPEDLNSWAGLALARRQATTPGARMLATRPEIVKAVHRAVEEQTGDRPDPDELAAWLTDGDTT